MKEALSGSIVRVGANQKSFILAERDEMWFGAYATDQLQGAGLGDTVQFSYDSVEKNGRVFNNIKGNVVVLGKTAAASASSGTPAPSLSREWLILRQNSLTNAVNFTANNPNSDCTVEAVLATATAFVAWTSGEADAELEAAPALEKGEPTVADWKEAAVGLVKETALG